MAGVLEPGSPIPPKSGPQSRINNFVTSLSNPLQGSGNPDEARFKQRFEESMGYGKTTLSDGSFGLNDASMGKFDTNRYLYYLDPSSSADFYDFQGAGKGIDTGVYDGSQEMAKGEYDIPTSTSNFKRPRTLAAGYDPNEGTVTVVFRDGTFYNYYGISAGTWSTFKEAYSKGPLLNGGNTPGGQAGKLDGLLLRECSARGQADLSSLGEEAQKFFVTVARAGQIALRSNVARKGGKFAKKTGPDKGTVGSRRSASISANVNTAASRGGKNPSMGGKNPYKI
jgi:hypothetical protein